ncbi:MAG: alkaline phosphatase D family protein [Aeoliella sp.]
MKSVDINRRTFIAGTTAGLSATGLLPTSASESNVERGEPLRAAVLEYADRWTKESTGLEELLSIAGFEVASLELDRSPLEQTSVPHLIAFGSFTNNSDAYNQYVSGYGTDLQSFVEAGGTVLEMTQSDQLGNSVPYLPAGMQAVRGDRDLSAILPIDADHPLVAGWFPDGAKQVGTEFFQRKNPNWESFERWQNLRVLLASEADGRSPCLLEGAHGNGRYLLSSLWIDKCYQPDGSLTYGEAAVSSSQKFFSSLANYVRLIKERNAQEVEPTEMPPARATGPMIGHVEDKSARIWFRPSDDHRTVREWTCSLRLDGKLVGSDQATPDADHDFTLVFEIDGLLADTKYAYWIHPAEEELAKSSTVGPFELTTGQPNELPATVVLGLGSCAPSDPNYVWNRIAEEGCEAFVFLGDTPYVDSSDLHVAREKHREFLSQPEISQMIANMPCWGTWDDHDFGRNDGHGDFPGKHVCRTAFTEYRANKEFGHKADGTLQTDRFGDGRGIYTSFRRGPIEVFLIDPRWFSRTEPSWADADQPTCLGKVQWEWLQEGLKNSTATFKALATGMIWDDKKNSERDDWHTYRHERDAIFDFIRDEQISGCFLLSGDIHVSRALNYGPRVGYDLWQFIVSPLHDGVIPQLDVPHPNLVHHVVEPYVFLKLEVDDRKSPAQLKATWINRDGKRFFEVQLDSNELDANT